MNESKKGIDAISNIVYQILEKEGLLKPHWHLGKVASVISSKMLNVYIDGSTVAQQVPCNPSQTFTVNDEVWIHYVNGDQKNKFCHGKRGV